MFSKKTTLCLTVICLMVVISSSSSYAYVSWLERNRHVSSNNAESESSKFNLLAKRIFIDEPNDTQVNFSPLKNQISTYYAAHNLVGSIYFEYLPTGSSIRINGDIKEVAASLLKVPAAMDLYKASELGHVNLDQHVTLTQEMLDNSFGNLYKKGAGYTLSLRDAAKSMLEQSDNTALAAIASSVKGKVPEDQTVFQYADIDYYQNKDLTVSVSAPAYSSFLKCLYFSCYNNKQNSQEILQYLSKSDFNNRLVSGIANKEIVVAHKIGTFGQNVQSDCGIVYFPRRNYLLCVMLQGPDTAETNEHISKISGLAYDYVKSLEK